MVRVLAYIDEPALAFGLEAAFKPEAGTIEMICVSSLSALWSTVEILQPTVILVNLTPGLNIQTIRSIAEGACASKVVLWVRSIEPSIAAEAVRAGVRGVLRKTLPNDLLVKCIKSVAQGELWIEKNLMKQIVDGGAIALTPRERDLLNALAHGLSNKEIAAVLKLADSSAKIYVSRLLKKLNLRDRFELGLYGLKHAGTLTVEHLIEDPAAIDPNAAERAYKQPGKSEVKPLLTARTA